MLTGNTESLHDQTKGTLAYEWGGFLFLLAVILTSGPDAGEKMAEKCSRVKFCLFKPSQAHVTPGANFVSERPCSNVQTASATSQQQQQQQWGQPFGHSDWNCNVDCLRR